jgi:restriction system protein
VPRRRNTDDPPLFDAVLDILKLTPVWVGPTLAAAIFLLLYYIIPFLIPASPNGLGPGIIVKTVLPMFGWLFAFVIMIAWIGAEIHKLYGKRLLNGRTGGGSIRDLTWQEFEHLVAEYYRRRGYVAEVVGASGGDGGVDIVLHGKGEQVLVQCKQWRAYNVGVSTVRELLGVVVSRRASKGIVVTSGSFTQEAVRFAAQNGELELVGGDQLADMICSVQDAVSSTPRTTPPSPVTKTFSSAPSCPACGAAMLLRTARRGSNAGSQFWGCSGYPQCRGTRVSG